MLSIEKSKEYLQFDSKKKTEIEMNLSAKEFRTLTGKS